MFSSLLYYRTIFLFQGPVVIVPTKYYKTPTDHFRDMGVSMVIWANHNLRASVSAIQQTTKQIYDDQSLVNVEDKVTIAHPCSTRISPKFLTDPLNKFFNLLVNKHKQ